MRQPRVSASEDGDTMGDNEDDAGDEEVADEEAEISSPLVEPPDFLGGGAASEARHASNSGSE